MAGGHVNTIKQQIPFSDLSLWRRLERAEGRSNADFVEARSKLFPESENEKAGLTPGFLALES
jgi:hypothetical protein